MAGGRQPSAPSRPTSSSFRGGGDEPGELGDGWGLHRRRKSNPGTTLFQQMDAIRRAAFFCIAERLGLL
jgi:hypothetical protein